MTSASTVVVCCDYNSSETALLPCACEKCFYYALSSAVSGFVKLWCSGQVGGLVSGVHHTVLFYDQSAQ